MNENNWRLNSNEIERSKTINSMDVQEDYDISDDEEECTTDNEKFALLTDEDIERSIKPTPYQRRCREICKVTRTF